MAGAGHEQRASKPAPRRYGSEANALWVALNIQDTPEAINGRLSGELPPGDVNFPSSQSSAAGGAFPG
jgi:hypothetical protein